MSERAEKPRRRIVFKVEIGADSWDAVVGALEDLAIEVDRGHWRGPNGCSAGSDYSFTLTASEDESVTHESYIAATRARLEAEKNAKPATAP